MSQVSSRDKQANGCKGFITDTFVGEEWDDFGCPRARNDVITVAWQRIKEQFTEKTSEFCEGI